MDETTISWLLESDPWVQYRARLDLLDEPEDDRQVLWAKEKILAHPQIRQIFSELPRWPVEVVSNHKSAGLLIHKLSFLSEVGLRSDTPEIKHILEEIMKHIDEGVPQVIVNVPTHFGGTGKDERGWALCAAPLVIYSLVSMDKTNAKIKQGLERLKKLARENGWPCSVSPQLGKFRGPGRKDDPCPYATLIMLKVLAAAGDTDCREAHAGAQCLLGLWEKSAEYHPYIFYMGTDFRKLKAPFVWYDILHVTDVLTRFEWLRGDKRLLEMLDIIKAKSKDSRFTPESEWKAWKGWDFGQKKEPSAWLTFLALRILRRA